MIKLKALYLTYDGLTDPVGQSQILNYLIPLSKLGVEYDIISFEKKERYNRYRYEVYEKIEDHKINWHPLSYTNKPPVLSKLWDRSSFFSLAKKLQKRKQYQIIHCRSYAASEIGLMLKRKFGCKFIFDMRGFWADEKADGGSWNRKSLFWNKVYLHYKRKEEAFVKESDHIVSLTKAGKEEMESWSFYNKKTPISVIPCCADMDLFSIVSEEKKKIARAILNIPKDAFVLSYLGSTGAWYMFDEMIDFYKVLLSRNPNAYFLVITNTDLELLQRRIDSTNIDSGHIILRNLPFSEVAKHMYASDLSMSFVKPVYSKMNSSPIKNGEILSMGIPLVLSNIGDAKLLAKHQSCYLIDDFNDDSYANIIANAMKNYKSFSPVSIREIAESNFSIEEGIDSYHRIYESLK